MNIKRNRFYLPLIFLYIILISSLLALLYFYLKNPNENFIQILNNKIILIVAICASLIIPFYSTILIWFVTEKLEQQNRNWNDNFILENLKRERSSLLMSIFVAFLLFPIFALINSFWKSGLSKKQRKYAIKYLKIYKLNEFLETKKVKEFLETNKDIKKNIDEILKIRNKKIDTKYNCNLYILTILNEMGLKVNIKFNDKDIYYIGMEY